MNRTMKRTRIVCRHKSCLSMTHTTNDWPCLQLAMQHMWCVLLIRSGSSAGELVIVISFQRRRKKQKNSNHNTIANRKCRKPFCLSISKAIDSTFDGIELIPFSLQLMLMMQQSATEAAQKQVRFWIPASLNALERDLLVSSLIAIYKAIHCNRSDVEFLLQKKQIWNRNSEQGNHRCVIMAWAVASRCQDC